MTVFALDTATAFVHACVHAALGNHPPRLVPLRDVVTLANAQPDLTEAFAVAQWLGVTAVVQRALVQTEQTLGVTFEPARVRAAAAYSPTRFDRLALRTYGPERSYGLQSALSAWALPTTRERLTYVAALAWPARDYVRARERSYARRWMRGVRVAAAAARTRERGS